MLPRSPGACSVGPCALHPRQGLVQLAVLASNARPLPVRGFGCSGLGFRVGFRV